MLYIHNLIYLRKRNQSDLHWWSAIHPHSVAMAPRLSLGRGEFTRLFISISSQTHMRGVWVEKSKVDAPHTSTRHKKDQWLWDFTSRAKVFWGKAMTTMWSPSHLPSLPVSLRGTIWQNANDHSESSLMIGPLWCHMTAHRICRSKLLCWVYIQSPNLYIFIFKCYVISFIHLLKYLSHRSVRVGRIFKRELRKKILHFNILTFSYIFQRRFKNLVSRDVLMHRVCVCA